MATGRRIQHQMQAAADVAVAPGARPPVAAKKPPRAKMMRQYDLVEKGRAYNPNTDEDLLNRAYVYAMMAHGEQKRASGDPYFSHPLEVAAILTELKLDDATIVAALLHDTIEDTEATRAEIDQVFGRDIGALVEGLTKLKRLELVSREAKQAENLRKIFLAMARDLRVILIKLADRLHNLRTLGALRPQKQEAIATETLEIFAPIASRLGVFQMKIELEDLSFRYRYPKEYAELVEGLHELRPVLERAMEEARQQLQQRLGALQIQAKLEWREKHLYSTFRKIQRTQRPLEDIYDLLALRIIVERVEDCYSTLGLVHSIWVPMKDRIKDYIAVPKSNNYRSLHTTVYGPGDHPLEIQIRTWEMHQVNEVGIAAHWAYKESSKAAPSKDTAMFKEIYPWIRAILDWHADSRDAKEYVDNLKVDLLSNEVFVFTPGGDVIDLPTGSVPIDFAYRVHTQVGHRCIGAKVNGKMVPFDYKLQNADVVEIVTSKNGTPSLDWLRICGSNQARNKIRAWFRKERREENVQRGRDILRRELAKQRMDGVLNDEPVMDTVARALNFEKGEDLLASIGFGETSLAQFLGRLREELPKETVQTRPPQARKGGSKRKSSQPIRVKGIENILIRFSKCCAPVPGDQVVGYITLGKGVSVHVRECPNLANLLQTSPERLIEVEWDAPADAGNYHVDLEIDAWDRNGLLSEVMSVLNDARIPTRSCKAWAKKDRAFIKMGVDILHKRQLDDLIKKLSRIRDVISVSRMHSNP